jgi:hypothetical protein
MKRDDWSAAVGSGHAPVKLDISGTILGGAARDSTVVAAIAHDFAPPTTRVEIYRDDPNDAPTSINKDDYEVWIDIQQHPKLGEMIGAASTADNANFRQYCREHVFIVKRTAGDDHWLKELPEPVKALLKPT